MNPITKWLDVMAPHIQRFEVAAALGADAVYNAVGSAAMAKLIKQMATIIDDKIDRRDAEENKMAFVKRIDDENKRRLTRVIKTKDGYFEAGTIVTVIGFDSEPGRPIVYSVEDDEGHSVIVTAADIAPLEPKYEKPIPEPFQGE